MVKTSISESLCEVMGLETWLKGEECLQLLQPGIQFLVPK